MTRSKWKGVFFTYETFKYKNNEFHSMNRNLNVLPIHINKILNIYNGKSFIPIKINKDEMLNHKIGEFSFTKKKCVNLKKEKKNLKKK